MIERPKRVQTGPVKEIPRFRPFTREQGIKTIGSFDKGDKIAVFICGARVVRAEIAGIKRNVPQTPNPIVCIREVGRGHYRLGGGTAAMSINRFEELGWPQRNIRKIPH